MRLGYNDSCKKHREPAFIRRIAMQNSVEEWRLEPIRAELLRRQKATATTIVGLIVGTILLSIVAAVGKRFFRHDQNPLLDIGLRITILIFGLGAVALRRTKFATMRLQDIADLRGASGLLVTLEKTTLQVALLGSAIAVIGFVATVITANDFYSYGAGIVAVAVLLYAYPTKKSWQKALLQFTGESDSLPPKPPTF